jgi:hypothetical protein
LLAFVKKKKKKKKKKERKAAIKLLVEFSYRFIGEGRRDDEEAGNGGCSNGGCSGEGCDDNRSTIWTGKSVFSDSCGERMQRRHRSSENSAF